MMYDVLVAGMGPVGATAAAFAGRAGLRTMAVDPSEAVFPLPRATHFDAEVMRLFQSVGLADTLNKVVATYDGGVHLGADGEPIRDFRVPAVPGPSGWFPHYTFIQPQVDQILRDAALGDPNVDGRLGWEVVATEQNADHVAVTISVPSGATEVVTAKFVIACDGASSPIRKSLGIDLIDYGFEEPWIIVDAIVPESAQLPNHSIMWCDPKRPGTYIPQPGRHRRWEFMLLADESPETMASRAVIEQLLRSSVDPDGVEIVRSAVYRFHGLIASQWRNGRIFLAGDAAHQTPPFYGQGMCHGIRDVSNLVWKLRLALDDPDMDPLLDSYAQERHPHVKTVIDASVENGRYICILDPVEAHERDTRLRARMAAGQDVRSFRSVIPGIVAGIALPADDTNENGQLMIQPEVETVDGRVQLMDEVLGSGFRLITRSQVTDPASASWFDTALSGVIVSLDDSGIARTAEAAAHGGPGPDETEPMGHSLFVDHSGEILKWFDKHEATAVLVRPDHYIFGVAEGEDGAERLLRSLREAIGSAGSK
ncbi:bifunctional 3-(3-hydroxy-phenyl)propionate/3-hydroxycinnamic acid hydroxylase [Streptomyces sp. NPDC050287]|uniref:bifunctional 3-(3-hydroxy-phenyl)propionate/3-hydroxycinnamic acid hydroxylase n=1 Tax=Streptomyces sp. NPDC050287 TaxID=3365608 RepID=UPI00379CD9A3